MKMSLVFLYRRNISYKNSVNIRIFKKEDSYLNSSSLDPKQGMFADTRILTAPYVHTGIQSNSIIKQTRYEENLQPYSNT